MFIRNEKGQALVEWVIFGSAILIFWVSSMHMAKRLLLQTASESWSMFAARQALSKATTLAPPSMKVHKTSRPTSGEAVVGFQDGVGATKVRSAIHVPKGDSAGPWFSSLLSFGSLFSLFSE